MNNIFEILDLCTKVNYVGQKIPKNMFYQQGNLSHDDEKTFVEFIEKIEMSYVLDSSNINIDVFINEEYNYSAIGYMKINLKKDDKVDKISRIIQSNIPNPLVIIFEYNCKVCISTSLKRINKSDNSKVVLECINTTPWIDMKNIDDNSEKFLGSISFESLDFTNFYEFYKLIDDRIYTFKNAEVMGGYETITDKSKIEDTKAIIEKINQYNEDLKKIVAKINRESQFNKKMKLNIEANNIKKEIEKLQANIKR